MKRTLKLSRTRISTRTGHAIPMRAAMSLLALLTCGLVACSATVTAPGGEIVAGNPEDPQPGARAAQGSWRSNCYKQDTAYVVENMTINERGLTMAVNVYWNAQCTGTPWTTQNLTGTFDVIAPSLVLARAYEVDVTIYPAGQPSQKTKALFLVEGTTMFLSDDASAPAGQRPTQVDRTKPYTRVGG